MDELNRTNEQTEVGRQDARLDACRKARLRVALREGRLHMPAGSRKLAAALGITTQELALDVERALLLFARRTTLVTSFTTR